MTVSAVGHVHGRDAAEVVARMTSQIADEAGTVPLGAPVRAIPDGFDWFFRVGSEASSGTLEDLSERVDDLETFQTAAEGDITTAQADIVTAQTAADDAQTYAGNINTWAVALATKLNADGGVTDVNYDTNPQA